MPCAYCVYTEFINLNLIYSILAVFFLLPESFFGDSFCVLNAVQDVSNFELSLQIKTSRRSGLLLLAAGMEDYLFLELLNGKVQVNVHQSQNINMLQH